MNIVRATSDAEIEACFPLFQILRPHLIGADFVSRVRRQERAGYHLVYLQDSECKAAAAGFRILEFLAWGRVLYIDDLITLPEKRGLGYGGALMDWLIAHAREQECAELHLDSGYQRKDAHRLYLNNGLQLDCHHFSMKLNVNSRNA